MLRSRGRKSVFGAFDDVEVVSDGASNDADDTERVEV
jgi:predicted protein tyrosine phosphatase